MQFSPRMIRIVQTINMNIVASCLGMTGSAYGATLLDLAEVFHASVEVVSFTLATRSAGSTVGALMGGLIYRSFNSQLVVAVFVLSGGLLMILVPLVPGVLLLHIVSFLFGVTMSVVDIGMHVWLQIIWKHEVGPQLQLYNLIFGLGGVVAPFICAPFLSSVVPDTNLTSNTNSALASTLLNKTASMGSSERIIKEAMGSSRIHIAYAIMGFIYLAAGVSFLVTYSLDRTDPKPEANSTGGDEVLPKRLKHIIIGLMCAYLFLGIVDEITFSAYLPTFAVRHENLRFTKSSGAYLASTFWTSFTISRLVATLLTLKLSPGKLIAIFHVILMISTLGMMFFIDKSSMVAWLGTVMVSFGLGPFFGNGTIWGVQYMVLTHVHMSVILLCVCVGMMVPGLLIGPFIDSCPMVFMWAHTILATALTIFAVVLLIFGRTPLLQEVKRKKADKDKA